MNYLECQQQLIDVISRIERNSEDLKQSLAGKTDIILLVGDTGSGKSTIFNLLCGAEFELTKENQIDVLNIKKGTKNYSKMKHGTKSVTKEPTYFYNQELNHLLIDFPGFKDTGGDIEELVIQLLFNKIVTKNKLKLVYIIQQPLVTLQNRGTFIQSFLQIFKDQKIRFSECHLILNLFTQNDVEENVLIKNIREELFSITNDYEQKNQTMFVIRNFNKERLGEVAKIRQNLWASLVKTTPRQFAPFHISKLEIIGKYLQKLSKILTSEMSDMLKYVVSDSIQTLSDENVLKLQTILMSFQLENSLSKNYQKLFQIHEELAVIYRVNKQSTAEQQMSFLKVLRFFEDYKDQIEGYDSLADSLSQVQSFTCLLSKQIEQKLASKKLEKEKVKELKKQQKEFQKLHEEMSKQFQEQLQKVREEQSKLKDSDLLEYKLKTEMEFALMQQKLDFEKEKQNQAQVNQNWEGGLRLVEIIVPLIEKKIGVSNNQQTPQQQQQPIQNEDV